MKENLSNIYDSEALSAAIEKITKLIKCSDCQSTVYLIGIGKNHFKDEIDISSEPIIQAIKRLVDLHKKYKTENTTANSFVGYSEEAEGLAYEIIEKLIWEPGKLLYFEDTALISDARNAVKDLWDSLPADELWEEISTGGFKGILVNIISDYIDRAKLLNPVFISIEPPNQIKKYFREAMGAWLFGLNTAALILCCSIIEKMLETIYPKLTKAEKEKKGKLEALIDKTNGKIFNETEAETAHIIRLLRNDAVHDLKRPSKEDTYEAILNTVSLIEKILREKSTVMGRS
ncbi:MAG: DUF4145 domain-containing protein [Nitrosopumilus sp.]